MQAILIVLFFVNGEWTVIDGWGPVSQADTPTCEARAQRVRDYIAPMDLPPSIVTCIEGS